MARRSTPNLSNAADQYVAQRFARNGSRGSRDAYRSLLGRFARALNDCQVGSLTPHRIEDFFYGPGGLADRCARSTLGKYRGDLKAFLTWCHRRKWCDSPDYLLGGIPDKSTRTARQRLRLTEAQLWAIVNAATDPRDRALIVFCMHTAVRISEALALKVSNLRLDAKQVKVRIIKTREEDVFNLSPTLENELREWLTVYTARENPGPDDYLFPARRSPRLVRGKVDTNQGYAPANPINNPRKIIRPLAESAGIELEDGDGWHTVRRSVARLFFDSASVRGHDSALRMTSALLHHKNTETTERYLGLALERVKRDEIMSAGFLESPASENVARLSDFRKAE